MTEGPEASFLANYINIFLEIENLKILKLLQEDINIMDHPIILINLN